MSVHENLEGFINEPTVMNQIIDALKQHVEAGCEEMTLTDIRHATGLKASQISRTMQRLRAKKICTRRKVERVWTYTHSTLQRDIMQQRHYWAYKLTGNHI